MLVTNESRLDEMFLLSKIYSVPDGTFGEGGDVSTNITSLGDLISSQQSVRFPGLCLPQIFSPYGTANESRNLCWIIPVVYFVFSNVFLGHCLFAKKYSSSPDNCGQCSCERRMPEAFNVGRKTSYNKVKSFRDEILSWAMMELMAMTDYDVIFASFFLQD